MDNNSSNSSEPASKSIVYDLAKPEEKPTYVEASPLPENMLKHVIEQNKANTREAHDKRARKNGNTGPDNIKWKKDEREPQKPPPPIARSHKPTATEILQSLKSSKEAGIDLSFKEATEIARFAPRPNNTKHPNTPSSRFI